MGGGLITEQYRALQKDLHEKYDYGKGVDAEECAGVVRGHFGPKNTVLDYGCGQGHLGRLLRPDYDVREYDPAINGKHHEPEAADVIVCADVMEHIEPECLDSVLGHIRTLARRAVIFVIATGPSNKVMADGRGAHLIVEGADWWVPKLEGWFKIVRAEDRTEDGKGLLVIAKPLWKIGEIPTKGAVLDDVRAANVRSNSAFFPHRLTPTADQMQDMPRMGETPIMPENGRTAILVCYGPSLMDTWGAVAIEADARCADVITCSGAYRFLRDRGITPMAHIEVDPRIHKLRQIQPLEPGTEFWLASCLHTEWQNALPKDQAKLWHAYNGSKSTEAVVEVDPGRGEICGGGSVGVRSIGLLYFLGYRHIVIHGMDSSFSDDHQHHAGPHGGKTLTEIEVRVKGRKFLTSPAFIAYARYFGELVQMIPDARIELAGDGMLQTMYCAQETAKA
jgi:hypothetical protein